MVARRGTSAVGCLVTVFVTSLVVYLSFHVGMAYLERYRFEEQMRHEIRFGGQRTDDEIKARLKAWADSSGYPAEAGSEVGIQRSEKQIRIWSDYEHQLRFPVFPRKLKFHPSAESQF